MRVLDTATILAAMAQVSPRPRSRSRAGTAPAEGPAPVSTSSGGRTRSFHPPAAPVERDPGEHDDGPRRLPRSALHVVPQGVIPVIVVSSRLAAARSSAA